ncbi:unnamed protein product [Urochloa humidicola]
MPAPTGARALRWPLCPVSPPAGTRALRTPSHAPVRHPATLATAGSWAATACAQWLAASAPALLYTTPATCGFVRCAWTCRPPAPVHGVGHRWTSTGHTRHARATACTLDVRPNVDSTGRMH